MPSPDKVEIVEPESAAEASPFVRIFETEGRVRVLDTLLQERDVALSMQEIADIADIDHSTVYRNMDALVEIGAVEKIEPRHGPTLYQADMEFGPMRAFHAARSELLPHTRSIEYDRLDRFEALTEDDLPAQPQLPSEAFESATRISRSIPDLIEDRESQSGEQVIAG